MEEDIKEILTALDNTTKKQLDEAIANADKEWSEMELEEDIKILEKFINDYKKLKEDEYLEAEENDIQAIEHLIARNKELEKENSDMKALLKIQASIAKELDFDTPDKMIKFRNSYYVPDTMAVRADIGKPKRLELSYVDVLKLLED